MNRPLLIETIFYLLLFIGLVARNGQVIVLTIPLAVYLGVGILFKPRKLQITIKRTLAEKRLPANRSAVIGLEILNSGQHLEQVLIEDVLPPGLRPVETVPRWFGSLATGSPLILTYTVTAERGVFPLNRIRLAATDHLAIAGRKTELSVPETQLFHPEKPRLQQIKIRPSRTHGYAGPIRSRQPGSGLDFFGVREYRPGDPRNRINWKLSQRHSRKVYTNEFERERIADVVLILDARLSSEIRVTRESLFEYALNATHSVAETFLSAGNRVSLLIYGLNPRWTFPGYGRLHLSRIEEALLRAKAEDGGLFEDMAHLSVRRFPANAQIVMVTALLNDDTPFFIRLKKHRFEILVVSPDPVAFESELLTYPGKPASPAGDLVLASRIAGLERVLQIKKLTRHGIRVVSWPVQSSLDRLLRTASNRPPYPARPMASEVVV